MKYLIVLIVSVCIATMVKAQQSKPVYTYRQKQLADSLRLIFPDLQNQNDESNIKPGFTMPVFPLSNEGVELNKNSAGTIYKMKPDNMLRLQPGETNAVMPNAMIGKAFVVPLAEKKP